MSTNNADLKIRIAHLDADHLNRALGLEWWDTEGADQHQAAALRKDNETTLAKMIGRRFYVIRCHDDLHPKYEKYILSDEPGRTNMSHDERVKGWLGTTNNINRRALGYFEVIGHNQTHLHLTEIAEEPEA